MSYRQETDNLSRHLGAAIAHREPLTGTDLDAAVSGFIATAHLLRDVHVSLVGSGPEGPRNLAALERDPIALLGRLLHRIPALPQAALTDLQTTPAATPAGAHWRAVARSATLAQHYWATASPRTLPSGPAAMTEIAVTARTAELLAVAGPDLARDLRAAGRGTDADRLLTATTSGLRSAATEARHQAAAQASTASLAEPVQQPPRSVFLVRRASHLPPALDQLAHLVRTANHLTPQHTQLVARATAEVSQAAATVLQAAGHPEVAAALRTQAHLLAQVATTGRTTASLTPADPRPLGQAQQIHQALAKLSAGTGLDALQAWRAAEAIPAVTIALGEAAWRETARGTWLVPSSSIDRTAPGWVPSAKEATPRITQRLTDASIHAARLAPLLAVDNAPAAVAALRGSSRTVTAELSPFARAVLAAPRPAQISHRRP